jgi:hypothetical protein
MKLAFWIPLLFATSALAQNSYSLADDRILMVQSSPNIRDERVIVEYDRNGKGRILTPTQFYSAARVPGTSTFVDGSYKTQLKQFDLHDGMVNVVKTCTPDLRGGAFLDKGTYDIRKNLYVAKVFVNGDSKTKLLTIDLHSPDCATQSVSLGASEASSIRDLVYDPKTNLFFAAVHTGGNDYELFKFDHDFKTATKVSPVFPIKFDYGSGTAMVKLVAGVAGEIWLNPGTVGAPITRIHTDTGRVDVIPVKIEDSKNVGAGKLAEYVKPYPMDSGKLRELSKLETGFCYRKDDVGYMLRDGRQDLIMIVRTDVAGDAVLKIPPSSRAIKLYLTGSPKWIISNPGKTKIGKIWAQGPRGSVSVSGDVGGAEIESVGGNSGSVWSCLKDASAAEFTIQVAKTRYEPLFAYVGTEKPGPIELPPFGNLTEKIKMPGSELRGDKVQGTYLVGANIMPHDDNLELNSMLRKSGRTWEPVFTASRELEKKLADTSYDVLLDDVQYAELKSEPFYVLSGGQGIAVFDSNSIIPSNRGLTRSNSYKVTESFANSITDVWKSNHIPLLTNRKPSGDFEKWQATQVTAEVKQQLSRFILSNLKVKDGYCPPTSIRTDSVTRADYSTGDISFANTAFRSAAGSQLVAAVINSFPFRCPKPGANAPAFPNSDPRLVWYIVKSNSSPKEIECDYCRTPVFPVQATDLDGDRKTDWIFVGGGGQFGALILFNDDFSTSVSTRASLRLPSNFIDTQFTLWTGRRRESKVPTISAAQIVPPSQPTAPGNTTAASGAPTPVVPCMIGPQSDLYVQTMFKAMDEQIQKINEAKRMTSREPIQVEVYDLKSGKKESAEENAKEAQRMKEMYESEIKNGIKEYCGAVKMIEGQLDKMESKASAQTSCSPGILSDYRNLISENRSKLRTNYAGKFDCN